MAGPDSIDFIRTFVSDLQKFAHPLIQRMADFGLMRDIKEIDHACYRVESLAQYDFIKNQLDSIATLLTEAPVNGRPIATFRLSKKISLHHGFSLDVIEIPAPKPGSPYAEGFEHLEAVTAMDLTAFRDRHPKHQWNTANFHAELNREISLRWDVGLIKFHELSLAKIIEFEQSR